MSAPPRSVAKTTLLLLPVQVTLALLPFLSARWFGRTEATDVYYFAWAVFQLAGSLVFAAYQDSALVPFYTEAKLKDPKSLGAFTGALLAYTLLLGGAIAAALALVAFAWFRARYEGPEFAAAAWMIPPFSFLLLALALKTFFGTLLNAEHHYFALPVANVLGMTTTIAIVLLRRDALGVMSLPLGQLAGELVALAVLLWAARRVARIPVKLTLRRTPELVALSKLIASEVGGSAVTRINPVVDQLMAGLAGVVGGGTLLRYSGDVASLPTSLLASALLPVLLSRMAGHAAAGEKAELRAVVRRALVAVMGVLLGAAALLYLARGPILRLAFLGGEMDAGGVDRMVRLLPYHLVGLAPFGALLVVVRAHVAIKNSTIMFGMGILNAALNAVFNVVLLKAIGLEGIALSTSCVQLAMALVLYLRFEAKLTGLSRAAAT